MASKKKTTPQNKPLKKGTIPSELRHDLVSNDWVVIATGRAKRPEQFQKEPHIPIKESKQDCPFERIETQAYPTAVFLKGTAVTQIPDSLEKLDWTTISFPNKYPAFMPGPSLRKRSVGPYQVIDGVGFHEVIVTKDHEKDVPQFSIQQVKELVDIYQARYLALMNEEFVHYISIFKNKGRGAGASIAHPHSQLIAAPITDPDIQRSLNSSAVYYGKNQRCVHCEMIAWDRQEGSRILYENEFFVVLCPFASRVAFEIRIYPLEHYAHFERIGENQKQQFAEALRIALRKLYQGLKDPDYNYFIHTAPADSKNNDHYHWHLEVLPKTATWAGFELGTGIEISTIEPERAAEFLRAQNHD